MLDNSAKYSDAVKEIRISAIETPNKNVRISVEDKGRGIPAKLREKVFEKFFRAKHEDIHATSGGIGLGLAIARGIVESQGGKIWIEDGRGDFVTAFVFQIPISEDETKAGEI